MIASRTLLATALAGALTLSAVPVWAAGKKVNADTSKSAAATPAQTAVQTVATAHALARYGDANKDALALVTAARMLKQVGSRASEAKRVGPEPKQTKPGDDKFTVESILARARTLAAGRADVLALADDVEKGGARGSTAGVQRWRELVLSGATDRYQVTFRGGEPAAFAVSGDGDSDLDLYVYDENGNLICKDEDNTDDALCRWEPKWTGLFVIRIKNRGVANQYVAAHN